MVELILLLGLGLANLTNTGCFLNTWDPDPNVRVLLLLQMSEESGPPRAHPNRPFLPDQPTALSPIRINGVVGP